MEQPSLWSVHDSIKLRIQSTKNNIDAWHLRLEELLGTAHVEIFKLINELQEEQKNVEEDIECVVRRECSIKLKIKSIEREQRIFTVLNEKDNNDVSDYLRTLTHEILVQSTK